MAKRRPKEKPLDLAAALGVVTDVLTQRLGLYIPDKDKDDRPIANHARWVDEARQLLTEINGGATALPPADGTWSSDEGKIIWEKTTIVYSYIRPAFFAANLDRLCEFLHRFGRATNQGEVVVEFDNNLYRLTEFGSMRGDKR